ncbi:MAG: TrkH family potassium uptake protein [Burkholderiales bacterium]|nr:TrkH family potassium uptake protein [Burkholderiales bacterium]
MRLAVVVHLVSVVLLGFAGAMLAPLVLAHALADGAERAYDLALAATAGTGALGWAATRGRRGELRPREGFLFVALVWTVLPGFAALPLLAYLPALSFTDAYFEAMSGLTATGATVLSGLDALPPSINLWRCTLQWLGGMGVIVLAVAVLPLLGVGGRQLLKAETPGPMKEAQLTPRIAETAKGLWLVYAGLTAACALVYRALGMDWLDAAMHAFSTLSLGGFSSHDASFAHWNSPALEAAAIAFMLLAGVSFATHFAAVYRTSVAPYRRDAEAGWFLALVAASVAAVALVLACEDGSDWTQALRHAAFNVVSVATTTGYSSADYAAWPVFAPLWMLFISAFATCSGSTGGGIKMMRALLMLQQARRELERLIHPRAVTPVKLGGQVVENRIIFAVLAYMLVYGVTIAAITLLLTATGLDLLTALSAAAACVNNVGPGLAAVGPTSTYAVLSDFQTWILTVAMLLGRLELLTVFVLATPAFWRG